MDLEHQVRKVELPFCDELAFNYGTKVDRGDQQLLLSGKNSGECGFYGPITAAGLEKGADIREALKKVNWDPCCLPSSVKAFMADSDRHLAGFSVGMDSGVSVAGISGSYGHELVVIRNGPKSVQVGVVTYLGTELGLSLPVGGSPTQALLLGDCRKISDYLGWFKTITYTGLSHNWGTSDAPWKPLSARYNGCDSKSLTSGASTSIAGASASLYDKLSKTVELRGPQIQPLLDMFDRAEKRALGIVSRKASPFSPADYSRKGCNEEILAQAGKSEVSHAILSGARDRSANGIMNLIKTDPVDPSTESQTTDK